MTGSSHNRHVCNFFSGMIMMTIKIVSLFRPGEAAVVDVHHTHTPCKSEQRRTKQRRLDDNVISGGPLNEEKLIDY